jgi:hydrogenase maturation protease
MNDARPTVVGVGNYYRGDDALGILAIRELGRRHPGAIRTAEAPGELAGLLDLWKAEDLVIVVDAVSPGKCPGQIHRLDAIHERVQTVQFRSSSHEFGLEDAIRLARTLNLLPKGLVVFGIEGEEFAQGVGLSDPVVKSLPELIRLIEHELHLPPA